MTKSERIQKSQKSGNSFCAIVGDRIRVIKGRKIPIGSEYEIMGEYIHRDCYNRPVAEYWMCNFHVLVLKRNSIIIA